MFKYTIIILTTFMLLLSMIIFNPDLGNYSPVTYSLFILLVSSFFAYIIYKHSTIYYFNKENKTKSIKPKYVKIPSSQLNKELFTAIMDLTFLVDLTGNIININNHCCRILGYNEDELLGLNIESLISDKTFKDSISSVYNLKNPITLFDINIVSKSNSDIPLNITVKPILNSRKTESIAFLIVGQDMRMIQKLKNEISDHSLTSFKLKHSEDMFKVMLESMPFSIILSDLIDNTILYINKKTEALFITDKQSALGKSALNYFVNDSDRNTIMNDLDSGKPVREREVLLKRSDNLPIVALITVCTTCYKGKDVVLTCISDITEQRKLQCEVVKSEETLRTLMNSIPDMITLTDLKGNISYANNSTYSILKYDKQNNPLPRNTLCLLEINERVKAKKSFKKLLRSNLPPIDYKYVKRDGTLFDGESNSTILRDSTGKPFGLLCVTRDITERKLIQDNLIKSKKEIEKINDELLKKNFILREKSIKDGLTNLYNHQYINEILEKELAKNDSIFSLMMLDIDYFKKVNDTFGHQIGDQVLVTLSNVIKNNVRSYDIVGRYGGEEFIIILPDLDVESAHKIAERIRKSIEDFQFDTDALNITISIGLTQLPQDKSYAYTAKSLVKKADLLLYSAKDKGRNRIEYEVI